MFRLVFVLCLELMGLPDSSVGKEFSCNTGDPNLIPGLERSTGEGIGYPLQYSWASLLAQLVKNPPAMQETWVQSLGWEDPLEKERLPTPVLWPRAFHELYSPGGCKESDTTERLSLSFSTGNTRSVTNNHWNSRSKTKKSETLLRIILNKILMNVHFCCIHPEVDCIEGLCILNLFHLQKCSSVQFSHSVVSNSL